MPTFATPSPIDLAIHMTVSEVTITASDRADTVVTVTPSNPDKAVDRRGAEETKVAFDGQRLTVNGPKPRLSWIGPTESVDLAIEVPTGSRFTAEVSVGSVRTRGRLGATRIKALTGGVDLDTTGDLWVRAGHGTATVDTVDGSAEITSDHGQIRIGTIAVNAVLKASHGSVQVGEVGGDLDAKLSYGDVNITTALASVTAKTAYGSIDIGEVSSGSISVETAFGEVTVGVRPGASAWLDLASKEGRVRNELEGDRAPEASDNTEASDSTVAVRARTRFGHITVQRAAKR